jgi:adenylate kinase
MNSLILLGPPGSGKGTYASALKESLGIPHISTGDMFREEIRGESGLGREIKGYLDRGDLVPDETTNRVVAGRLAKDDCRPGFLLDGYPRTVGQAEELDRTLRARGGRVKGALLVELSEATLVKRISGRRVCSQCGRVFNVHTAMRPKKEGVCDKCGGALAQRGDDREETARHRLELYRNQTLSLVEYYDRRGILVHVNGEADLNEAVESMKRDIAALA